jgi:hypothetical protein
MTKFGFFKLLLPYSLQAHQNNLALKKNSRSQGFSFCNEKVEREREREREREKGQEKRDLESWRFLQRIRVRFWVCGINCRNGFVDQFQVARIEARDLGFRIEEIQNTRNPR